MKKKVLHYIPGFYIGGIESLFLDLIKYVNKKEYEVYLLTEREVDNNTREILKKNGVEIIVVSNKIKKNPIKYLEEMYKILKKGKWDILHLHISYGRDFMIYFSKYLKLRIIMHAHTTKIGIDSKCGRFIFLNLISKKNIEFIACSEEAGKYFYGEKIKYEVITNGIDFRKYEYDKNIKKEYNRMLHLEGKKIIGMIGRISYQKNQRFAIEIFEKLQNLSQDYILLLIGNEADEKGIPQLVREKGLEKKVIFLGARSDIKELLSLIDIYLMPSRYEGLSVGLLEAQASGVQCLISDTITPKNIITKNVKALGLSDSPERWAEEIIKLYNKGRENIDYKKLENSEYSIKTFVEKVERIYEE